MAMTADNPKPLVSIVMPVWNEVTAIESAITSALGQTCGDFDMELILVDGGSTDGTPEIVRRIAAYDSRLHIVNNPARRTPVAFNRGIARARGQYICILGAHTEYASDYIATCLSELRRTGAAGCSGRVITVPASDSSEAKLVAMALTSKFGSSSGSFRTQHEGFVDSIPYPLFRAEVLHEVGGYDESLTRNQDNDLNQRVRERGHRLYLTEKTRCWYRAQPSVTALVRYAFRNGFWNAISMRRNRKSMNAHHLVPAFFVVGLLLAIGARLGYITGFLPPSVAHTSAAPFAAYIVMAGAYSGWKAWRSKSWLPCLLPQLFLLFHVAYGTGTLWGVVSGATQRARRETSARRSIIEPTG